MVIVALVVLSAFLHALWNALLRLEQDKDRSLVVAIVVGVAFAAVVAGARWAGGEVLFASARGVGFTLLAGVMEAMYFATLARAMELGRLGVVYTISRGGAVVAVWPLSIALFGEAARLSSLAGSAVVVGGLALSGLSRGSGGGRQPGAGRDVNSGAGGASGNSGADTPRNGGVTNRGNPSASSTQRAAVSWAVACAASIAGYHLAYTAALDEATNPSACFALSLGVSVAINAAQLARRGRADGLRALVRQRPRLIGMGLVASGSFLILMEALARGGAGYVLTLRNTSVLFALLMGWRIGERPRRTEIIGAALVAAGATLMAL